MYQVTPGGRRPIWGALGCVMLVAAWAAPVALAESLNNADADLRGVVPTVSLVGQGNVQVETGVAADQEASGHHLLRTWSTPTLLRFGMPNYELRIQSDAYSHVRTYSAVKTGMSDLAFGFKGLVPQSLDPRLSVAVLLQAAFPNGSSQIRNNGVRPEFDLVGEWQLPRANTVGGLAGLRSDVDSHRKHFRTGIVGLNFVHAWNARFSSTTELAAREIRTASHGGKNVVWNFGAAWRAIPGTQLNARAGWGLTGMDTDWAWTVGVSTRFRPPDPSAMAHRHQPKAEEPPTANAGESQ